MKNNMFKAHWLLLFGLLFLTGCSTLGVDFGSGGSASSTCFSKDDNFQRLCQVDSSGGAPQLKGFCIITKIVNDIKQMLHHAAGNLFEGIRKSLIIEVVPYVLTLFITGYGASVLMGLVQVSGWDAFVRLVKFGIVTSVMAPTGWTFFETYVAQFFRDGADSIIKTTSDIMITQLITAFPAAANVGTNSVQRFLADMQTAMAGFSYAGETSNPFLPIDILLGLVISPKTLAVLQAAGSEGTAGWGSAYIAIYGLGVLFFIGAIARALWVYLMSLVATALLFGLFPIFIIFLLFDRTKGLFDGYLKLLISFMIQPIMMFMFITLFVAIISASLDDITKTLNVCYSCSAQGTEQTANGCGWKFTDPDMQIFCRPDSSGLVGVGPDTQAACDEISQNLSKMFPNLLMFFLLAYICWNFIDFVSVIAMSLAGGMNLSNIQSFLHGTIGGAITNLQKQVGQQLMK